MNLCLELKSAGGYHADARVEDQSGQLLTPDQAIEQLKADPRFPPYLPTEPPCVSLNDPEAVRKNFSKIASGEVTANYF